MRSITQENDRLGFVGIGYMGRPMARRLLEAGFISHDLSIRSVFLRDGTWDVNVGSGNFVVRVAAENMKEEK